MSPPGWSEENTATFFSQEWTSSRRVISVALSSGTKQIGVRDRISASVGKGSSQKADGSMLTTGALDMAKSSRTAQMIDTTGVAHCYT